MVQCLILFLICSSDGPPVIYAEILMLRAAWYAQVVLPVAVLAFAGFKWYHRSRRRRRQREEKQIVRQGSRSQDIRDLNV